MRANENLHSVYISSKKKKKKKIYMRVIFAVRVRKKMTERMYYLYINHILLEILLYHGTQCFNLQ